MYRSPADLIGDVTGTRSRIRSVFQPIIELATQRIIGYEALARFPDTPDLGPAEVFGMARAAGLLSDLDWECRRSAVRGAVHGGLAAPLYLFVNVEPSVLGTPPPWPVDPDVVDSTVDRVPTVLELTERALLSDPRSVLWSADWAHERRCMIALDDVGVNPESLTMLGILAPDIIKLDRSMLTDEPSAEQRRTLRAVWDHIGRTGAHLVCEGIESERDLDVARAIGATLGQGYHIGRPDELHVDDGVHVAGRAAPILAGSRVPRPVSTDPAAVLANGRGRLIRGPELRRIIGAFGAMTPGRGLGVDQNSPDGCFLMSLPEEDIYTPEFARRCSELASSNVLVGVIGAGDRLGPGVRGSSVPPIRDYLAAVIRTSEFGVAIVSRDIGDDGPRDERRFEWTLTHDDDEVIDVARSLVRRLSPARTYADTDAIARRRDPVDPTASALAQIVELAVRVVPGVDSAGLTLASTPPALRTVATSDQYPFLIDQLQQLYRQGPSLEAAQGDPVVRIENLARDHRWPRFRVAVAAATPIASILSFRLFSGPDGSGFLTLFAELDTAFDAAAVDAAHAFADHVTTVWVDIRAGQDPASADVATTLPRTALSDELDAAVATVARCLGTSPRTALRSILDYAATTGTSLQQTAHRLVEATDSESLRDFTSDFGSAGSP